MKKKYLLILIFLLLPALMMAGCSSVVRQIKSTTISHFILSRIAQSRLYEA
ncbi:MAG: hypothetical protein PWP62_2170 [Eubacteriaceae bacterium]|jgi:uncharacterized protein YceK|nr:hypothetical protein [Eubacteriaceae bacterium]